MSKNSGGSGFFAYIRRMTFGIVVSVITLGIIGFAFVDNWNNEPKKSRQLETGAVNSLKNTYNKESGPVSEYVQDRTNGDLKDAAPQIHLISQLGKNVVNHIKRTPVNHVSLDDSGNGIFVINHKQYLFKLNDTNFVPHNSKYYQTNKGAIQQSIANETNSGQFYVTRTGRNGINLYKGDSLVANTFISKGYAYIPDLTIKNPVTATQRASELKAKHDKLGIWAMNKIVTGSNNKQKYNLNAEKGHHFSTNDSNSNQKGGASATQHVSHWLGEH